MILKTTLAFLLLVSQDDPLRVTIDFPGGSAKVESIDAPTRTVRISPSTVPDRGWVCWWYFKLDGLRPGETVTLEVNGGGFALPDRAMFSLDNQVWTHTAPGRKEKGKVTYTQEMKARHAWFAWGPPYQLKHAQAAVEAAAKTGRHVKAFELTKSADGRPVPALRVGEPGDPRYGLWVQARQHAWESGGSWVCQGFIDWVVSDDPRAKALRERTDIVIVPIMDVDNVERGAGGKEAKPQDHNRDWSDAPHWPEVRAAQAEIKKMNAEGRFDFFIDLHNPGPSDATPFFFTPVVSSLSEKAQANLKSFLEASKAEITGPLAIGGKTRESGPSYDPKNWERISKNWVARNVKDHAVSLTLETTWNSPKSTAENYRRIGRELGLAIERTLRDGYRP